MKYSGVIIWSCLMIGSAIVLCASFDCWPVRRFYYSAVCSRCGEAKSAIEWQLPNTERSLVSHSSICETPVSRYLKTAGLALPHQHDWLFVHGGGNGVRCALGDGHLISNSLWSTNVARLLALSSQYGEQSDSTYFLQYTFDKEMSYWMQSLALSVPTNGFSSRQEYLDWLASESWVIEEALTQNNRSR